MCHECHDRHCGIATIEEKKVKIITLALLFFVPMVASAEYMDVIEFELNDGCSFGKYMEIVNDFNKDWGEANGYTSRIAMPLQNENLVSMYWLGTTKDAATYGKAWDTWRDAQSDPDSTPAKLWERFQACSTNIGRWGYDIY
jgi:hypothetical protein